LYSLPYGNGDVIGCGLMISSGTIFYSLNGCFIGVAARINPSTVYNMYPSVSIQGPGRVILNYGQREFQFDINKPTYQKSMDGYVRSIDHVSSLLQSDNISPRMNNSIFSPKKKNSDSPSTPITSKSPMTSFWEYSRQTMRDTLKKDVLSGLFTLNDSIPLPLSSVHVRVLALNTMAEVTVTQHFINHRTKEVEGIYYFPVTPSSLVRFNVEISSKIYHSSLAPRDDQDDQIQPEVDIPEDNGTTLCAHIKRISPGKRVSISITYIINMIITHDYVSLPIPSHICPSYSSHWNQYVYAPTDGPFEYTSSGLHLEAQIHNYSRINDLQCSTHKTADNVSQ